LFLLLLGFVRCFFSSTRPRSDRNNRSTTPSSSSFLLLFLLLLRDILATTSFSATFNLCSPLRRLLFLRGKNTREKATTNSPLLKAFLVVVVFVLAFVSFTNYYSQNAEERRQKKKKRRRRRRDRRRGNKSRNARFSPSSFLSRILLSLSLSRGLLFPEVVMYTRGQNKNKNNGIWGEKRSGFKSDRRNARFRSSSRTTFQW